MRLLILADGESGPNNAKFLNSRHSYHLMRAFADSGMEISFFSREPGSPGWEKALIKEARDQDAILTFENRYLGFFTPRIYSLVKKNFHGSIGHLCNSRPKNEPHAEFSLLVADSMEEHIPYNGRILYLDHSSYIGWAADPEIFKPVTHDALRIFIDHPAFDCQSADYTLPILMNLNRIEKPFEVRSIGDNGFISIDPVSPSLSPYRGYPVSGQDFARELGQADIFIATHPERSGRKIIEAATSGCFIVTPPGCIPPEILSLINHLIFEGLIDWEICLKNINPEYNRRKVLQRNWNLLSRRIIDRLEKSMETAPMAMNG